MDDRQAKKELPTAPSLLRVHFVKSGNSRFDIWPGLNSNIMTKIIFSLLNMFIS